MANTLEELPIYTKAMEFWVAVNALLDRPEFGRNRDLREQITGANDSITANMREGFEQSTDDNFAKYVYTAKGSVGEVLARLATAHQKEWLTSEEFQRVAAIGEELCRMLGGFIKYLARSGFKNRGRHKAMTARMRDSR